MRGRVERSAGVVVVTPDRRYLLLDYGKHWDFPKGHLEAGEDDRTAALRELREETGLDPDSVRLIPGFCHEIRYFFRDKKGRLVNKSVGFFLGECDVKEVVLSHEHVCHALLPFEQAVRRVTHANAKQLLRDAHAFLTNLDGTTH